MGTNVSISNIDEVFVHVTCEEGISYELKDHFTFLVPGAQFSPAFKSRIWDGKIRLFNSRTHRIYRGLMPKVAEFCEERGYSWEYDNEVYNEEFSAFEAQEFIKKLNPKYETRDYQLESFIHCIRNRRTLLLSPTASGKSFIYYLIANKILSDGGKKGLILVPTVSLVEQMYTDFQDYSSNNGWDVEKYIHRIYQGKEKDSKKPITVSTWQSLFKQPPEYFKQFDFIIGDEAHGYKAESLKIIMEGLTNCYYRIGMTGSLDGTKTHKLVLEGLFGPTHRIVTTDDLMQRKLVSEFNIKALLLKHNDGVCQAMKNATYQQEMVYLIGNEARNKFIVNLTLSLEQNTLVLYQYVDKHGMILRDMINTKIAGTNRKCFFIYGKTDVDIREETRRIVETEKDAIIIASYGTFSTGVNIKNLHNIIFASPSKSRIRNLQSIGRSLRISDTKDSATLFDIADDLRYKNHENFTIKHFSERLKLYAEEKFKFKIYKIMLGTKVG